MSTTEKEGMPPTGSGDKPGPKIIKRYSNRKLYDTERSCYVTLDEIGRMVRENVEIKIVDNRTKDDLTAVTLTQILYAEEKKQRSFLPLGTLRNIIKGSGEQVADFVQQRIAQPVTHLKEAAQQRVGEIFKRGDKTAAEAPADEPRTGLREWLESKQRAIEESQRRLDDRVKLAFDSLTHIPAIRDEINDLRRRVEEIEQKLNGR